MGYVYSLLKVYSWFIQGLQSDLHLAEIACVAWVLFIVITLNSLGPYKPGARCNYLWLHYNTDAS